MKKTVAVQVKSFSAISHIVLIIASIVAILPFLLLIVSSVTSEKEVVRNGYSLFPHKLSLDAYSYLWSQKEMILNAYSISIFVTLFGTFVSLLLITLLAYPLSRDTLKGRNIFNFMVFFTMLFNGGLVPSYIMWTQYFHMKNSIWALIIPNLLMRPFYVILARSYFQSSIPNEIIESTTIDGAGEWRIFYSIILPLSKPILATLMLFVGLGYWNDWNNGLIFLTDPKLYNIQNVLNEMIKSIEFMQNQSGIISAVQLPSSTVRMAVAVIGTVPVLLVYPFIQKSFVKGITLGSVKG